MTHLDRLREAKAVVRRAAFDRYVARTAEREHSKTIVAADGPGSADSPQRQERYRARLSGISAARVLRQAGRLPFGMERRMGATLDFSPFAPSEGARKAGRPVTRIVGLAATGIEPEGFATGFLISSGLLMTNWHVFSSRTDAYGCGANFLHERTEQGLQRGTTFALAPDRFFISDDKLDFAIIAVEPRAADGQALADFGQVTLIEATPKILKGQPVNIIQHPEGGPKQYAIAQNRLVDILEGDGFLHYETDTLAGSSGSPAFSENWELVALHHAAIPLMREGRVIARDGSAWTEEMGDEQVQWIANEGARVSAIVARLASIAPATAAEQAMLRQLLADTTDPVEETIQAAGKPEAESLVLAGQSIMGGLQPAMAAQFVFTGPVTIHVHAAPSAAPEVQVSPEPEASRVIATGIEASIRFDPDYDGRDGYGEGFLDDTGAITVPVPGISPVRSDEMLNDDAGLPLVLKYHHFELVMNKLRRLQMWSAVNVNYDPQVKSDKGREAFGRDRWIPDKRIPAAAQIFDADFYKPAGNIDRGHVVRREDNAWGGNALEIEFANSDTFHWTNCTPQHEAFNQSTPGRSDGAYQGMEGIWGAFENHIQQSRTGDSTKACILAGPILDNANDPSADFGLGPVQYPLRFWKVVCIADDDGAGPQLKAFGFILNQKYVVDRFGIERFGPERFKRYQVPLGEIETAAGVTFDPALHTADTMTGQTRQEIATMADVKGTS